MTVFHSPEDTAGTPSPFHYGEQQVQERLGVRQIEDFARKVIRPYMPDQHRNFFEAQPFLIVSARDNHGRPWATVLEGAEGFVASPDPETLTIGARPVPGDALEQSFSTGTDIGILGIELETRRRNRVNGHVADNRDGQISFAVGQSFGNCPQYIRERPYWRVSERTPGPVQRGGGLSETQQDWIRAADTFFIASGYRGEGEDRSFGMDVSHRGGERGFIEVIDDRTIRFPDYAGNNHYNTIGNLLVDPRAGFLFLDFSSGSLLQLTGTASIDWESEDVDAVPGARRLITLTIEESVELPSALRLRWQEEADSARSLRLVEKTRESADVMSFVFEARDGGPLAPFKAGQHLPIELQIPGAGAKISRSYSLSGSPKDSGYRISVKRDPHGLGSRYLHDGLDVGSLVQSRKPAGGFEVLDGDAPLILVSAGIGVTPMLSILHEVAAEPGSRPVWFVHSARDGAHHPFSDEVIKLAEGREWINVLTHYSQPQSSDRLGEDYHRSGRITAASLTELIPGPGTEYLLCGPAGFTAEIKSGLEAHGIPETRIHSESFG
ncbi:pyridoxamine 5'-phosphate oxidase family protein [Labrenzia sp. PHM005]|uniref:FAD-binding oxidoreductase n=1 Tax=Labrenzia sp. PHM005 TaxID=2590016 RepID=UPI00143D9E71|nr:pyridoxamine 5'-phosphate oxidase family protein [Labrenzia sp. PHM005]